jgi:hypothetical protein
VYGVQSATPAHGLPLMVGLVAMLPALVVWLAVPLLHGEPPTSSETSTTPSRTPAQQA